MKMHLRFALIAGVAFVAITQIFAQGGGYKVVVHPSNPLTTIGKDELAQIFLKKSAVFPNGHKASPVDLPINSSIRDSFSKSVLGKPASAVGSYWQQQIFSGKDVPPPLRSEDAARSFVLANENGIAYVAAGADVTGMKVIAVGQ